VAGLDAGTPHDERHVQGGLVHEEAVHGLFVLAETFAVVRRHDEERIFLEPGLCEHRVEPADERVGPGDLAVVRAPGVVRRERFRGLVRVVGIVEVQPREEALALLLLLEPGDRLCRGHVAPPLDRVEEPCIVLADLEAIGIGVEAARQPRLPREHDGGDEPRRGKSP
jgi:hypothetical protein